jgi:hypothetical protein
MCMLTNAADRQAVTRWYLTFWLDAAFPCVLRLDDALGQEHGHLRVLCIPAVMSCVGENRVWLLADVERAWCCEPV